MNRLYADKSTDQHYSLLPSRHIFAESHCKLVPEWQVYLMPDQLSTTATSLDQLPAWYLQVGALFFRKPITRMFNMPYP